MTRRKCGVLALTLLVCVAACLAWVAMPRPRSAINEDNFQTLEVGNHRDEVERILGGPPRDESSGPLLALAWGHGADEHEKWLQAGQPVSRWVSDELIVNAVFNGEDRLREKSFVRVRRYRTGVYRFIERLFE